MSDGNLIDITTPVQIAEGSAERGPFHGDQGTKCKEVDQEEEKMVGVGIVFDEEREGLVVAQLVPGSGASLCGNILVCGLFVRCLACILLSTSGPTPAAFICQLVCISISHARP